MLRFRNFLLNVESAEMQWGFFGDLKASLGHNQNERLNYGTAPAFGGSPMLYVPLIRGESPISQTLASVRRMLSRTGMQCVKDGTAFNGWRCFPSPTGHKADIMHTGEAHVTVALGAELQPIIEQAGQPAERFLETVRLPNGQPLFDRGVGLEMPVKPLGKLIYGVAKAFQGKPLVALMAVECPSVLEVRRAVGLPPPRSGYIFHVTVGYAFGNWTDEDVTTRKAAPLATIKHNAGYLGQLPEWFEYIGSQTIAA
jgi:hypothetical protein